MNFTTPKNFAGMINSMTPETFKYFLDISFNDEHHIWDIWSRSNTHAKKTIIRWQEEEYGTGKLYFLALGIMTSLEAK